MNDFIEVTNQVIVDQLKDKIKLSNIEYSVIDQVFQIKVTFRDVDYKQKGFKFMECSQDLDKEVLKMRFECFIKGLKF